MAAPLNIGLLGAVPAAEIEEGLTKLTVAEEAVKYLERVGLTMPTRPNYDGQQRYQGVLPSNVVELPDNQLGMLLNDVASWCSFCQTQLALARAGRNEAEAKLEFVRSRIRMTYKNNETTAKLSNPDRDDMVKADPRVIEMQRNFLYCDMVCDLTRQLADAAQRDWETISRRITQRGQEIDRTRRGDAVGGQGFAPVFSTHRR